MQNTRTSGASIFQYSRCFMKKHIFVNFRILESQRFPYFDKTAIPLRFCDSSCDSAIPVAIPNWVCDSETPAIPESQRFYHTKPAASFQAVAARQDVAAHGA